MSNFNKGQCVTFKGCGEYAYQYPDDERYAGQRGVITFAESGYLIKVRMPDGHILEGWSDSYYTPDGAPSEYVQWAEEPSGRVLETKHVDLDAAIQWLRDNALSGRFTARYGRDGETYHARIDVTRV